MNHESILYGFVLDHRHEGTQINDSMFALRKIQSGVEMPQSGARELHPVLVQVQDETQVHHLRKGKQNWNISLFTDVNCRLERWVRRKVNDDAPLYPGTRAVGEGHEGVASMPLNFAAALFGRPGKSFDCRS